MTNDEPTQLDDASPVEEVEEVEVAALSSSVPETSFRSAPSLVRNVVNGFTILEAARARLPEEVHIADLSGRGLETFEEDDLDFFDNLKVSPSDEREFSSRKVPPLLTPSLSPISFSAPRCERQQSEERGGALAPQAGRASSAGEVPGRPEHQLRGRLLEPQGSGRLLQHLGPQVLR